MSKRKPLTRQESQEQTRQNLLDEAIKVFAKKGIAGTSLDEIAKRAGYSKGAVYSNFTSKDDLALTVLERQAEAQLEALKNLIPSQGGDPAFWAEQGQSSESQGPWEELLMEVSVRAIHNPALKKRLAAYHQHIIEEAAQILAGDKSPTQEQRDAVIATTALASGMAMRYVAMPDGHLFEIWGRVIALLFNELNK